MTKKSTNKSNDTSATKPNLKLTNRLLGLPPEVVITGQIPHPHAVIITISFPEPEERICPHCGSLHCVIKGSLQPQTVRHIPVAGNPSFLSFKKHRYLCRDCGKSFFEQPEWLHTALRMSTLLFFQISLDLTEPLSLSAIARNRCVTAAVVGDVLGSIPMPPPGRLPETLCMDEFKGNAGTWDRARGGWDKEKFLCNIADGQAGCIIDILPSIRSEYIIPYFFQFPLSERQKVRFFCCDMTNGYVSIARHCFPNATVCIDLFHVVKRLNTAMDEVRRRLQHECREENPELYALLKHASKTLLTKKETLESYPENTYLRKKERIDAILEAFPDIRTVYNSIQQFHSINGNNQYALKRIDLTSWINAALSSEVPELRSAANTVKHWRACIQNSWKYDRSNGVCEGLNNKIKVLKRVSFGIHDFSSFRKRILLVCGYVHPADVSLSMRELPGRKAKEPGKEGKQP